MRVDPASDRFQCGHTVCSSCVVGMLDASATGGPIFCCPLCRAPVVICPVMSRQFLSVVRSLLFAEEVSTEADYQRVRQQLHAVFERVSYAE